MKAAIEFTEKGLVPEPLIRFGIDRLIRKRLHERPYTNNKERQAYLEKLLTKLAELPPAVDTDAANEQHYEVPAAFYKTVLGKNLKYSGSLWEKGVANLDEAENAMLEHYAATAQIKDGMRILDLGCGWGSLSFFLAKRFPKAKITAVSNSASQKAYIDSKANKQNITNLQVLTKNVNDLTFERSFDRILSVEMLEHVRNHKLILKRLSNWLLPDGKLFIHIFCHRDYCYLFETDGTHNWMGRTFFTGGIMPSEDLLPRLAEDFQLEQLNFVNGVHYQKTAEAWHRNLVINKKNLMPVLQSIYGSDANRWFYRWKIFFLSCAQLFGFSNGQEWGVAHYLFSLRDKNGG